MVRHPHRPKVGQNIGPPRRMQKLQSHGVPPEGALRIKWMRMMAKCNMTESTVSRRPRPIRMGRFRRKSCPPQAPRVASSCMLCWSIVAAICMVRDDMRDERIMP